MKSSIREYIRFFLPLLTIVFVLGGTLYLLGEKGNGGNIQVSGRTGREFLQQDDINNDKLTEQHQFTATRSRRDGDDDHKDGDGDGDGNSDSDDSNSESDTDSGNSDDDSDGGNSDDDDRYTPKFLPNPFI